MKKITGIDVHRWYAVISYDDDTTSILASTDNGLCGYDTYAEYEEAL